MINILIHTSINARGYLMDFIKRNLTEFENENGDTVTFNTPSLDHSKSWLLESINENKMPDIMLTHASDYSVLEAEMYNKLFSKSVEVLGENNFVRKELKVLEEAESFFYPLFIVPMVMIYNEKKIKKENLTNSWRDLFNKELKVIFPDKETPISKVVMATLKTNYPTEFNEFMKKVTFGNSPVEVIQAVATGQYDIGISNLSFSMMARQKNIEINWPIEGAIPLPQVLVWKKNANPNLKKIIELLTNDELQRYLGEQGFWPICANAPLKEFSSDNMWLKSWGGWEPFMKQIQAIETTKEGGNI